MCARELCDGCLMEIKWEYNRNRKAIFAGGCGCIYGLNRIGHINYFIKAKPLKQSKSFGSPVVFFLLQKLQILFQLQNLFL